MENLKKIIKKGDHDEVMAELRETWFPLDKRAVKMLFKRGNLEEIVLALEISFRLGWGVKKDFIRILKGGNSKEIVTYLKNKMIPLDRGAVKILLKRDDLDKILIAWERKTSPRRSSHESNEEEPLQALMNMDMSECTCRLSLMDAPYHLY